MKTTAWRKVTALILAAAMALSMAACGGQAQSTANSTAGSETAASQQGDGSMKISDEPITLTAHIHNANTEVLNDEWRITEYAGDLTNIYLEGTASVNETDSQNAFNLMIAGKDLPDLVGGNSIDLVKYGMEGAFIPLEDLIEEHAPNVMAMFEKYPEVRSIITAADGHIYYLPTLEDSQVSQCWFIRQDWLDAVGKEMPTTVEELYDVMVAFRDGDPNGNGQKDEIGFLNRNQIGSDLTGGLTALFSLYGVNTTFYVEDGKIGIGINTPEFKEAMKNVSKWYAEDLIDPEIFTRGNNARDVLFAANNGALTHDWYASTSGYNEKMQEQVPGFKLVGMMPVADINGDVWEVESRQTVTPYGTAISYSNENPVETIKYLDFWFSEFGERLATYGIEGDTYEMVDGKPVYTELVMNNELPVNAYMKSIGGQQYQLAHVNLSEYETFMMSPEGIEAMEMYRDGDVVNKKFPKIPALSFTEEESDIIQSKWAVISTYVQEQIQKWTFDGSTIDADFDKYLSDIEAMGIQDVLNAYQAAYDRTMKQ